MTSPDEYNPLDYQSDHCRSGALKSDHLDPDDGRPDHLNSNQASTGWPVTLSMRVTRREVGP